MSHTQRLLATVVIIGLTGPGISMPDQGIATTTPYNESGETVRLTLLNALTLGIEHNLGVKVQRYKPLIAGQEFQRAQGVYAPELFSDYTYDSTEIPIATELQSDSLLDNRVKGAGVGVRGLVPRIGGDWHLGYSGEALETNSAIETLSPSYRSGIEARLSIPLLRDFLWNEPWVEVKLSHLRHRSSQDDFHSNLIHTVRDIELAYWELVASEEQFRVARKSLNTAKALLNQTQAQFEVGSVSRVEVVEAEAGAAEREFNLIIANNRYHNDLDRLIDHVYGIRLTSTSNLVIEPADDPEVITYEVDPKVTVAKAFANRPELKSARKTIEQDELRLRFALNQRLPQFNLIGTYGYEGIGGKENPDRLIIPRDSDGDGNLDPPRRVNVTREFKDTIDDFFDASGAKRWSLGGLFSYPLGNRSAKSTVRSREFELRRDQSKLKQLEQAIVLEIRIAIRDLNSARQGIDAAERRRLAAAEQLRAEQVRLEFGEATPFDVLERERDLVDAESQKIGALQAYRASIARLDASQGTILGDRNILIEDARLLR